MMDCFQADHKTAYRKRIGDGILRTRTLAEEGRVLRTWVPSKLNILKESSSGPGRSAKPQHRERGKASLKSANSSFGTSEPVKAVFKRHSLRDTFLLTALIKEHTRCGKGREALRIYKKMREDRVKASTYTFVAALKASRSLRDLESGRAIHADVIESGAESQICVASTLLDMYSKCGSMDEARQVFDGMPRHDVVSWTAMILGYAQAEQGELGLQLYKRMQQEGVTPDDRTFVAVLKACSSLADQEEGQKVDGSFVKVGCLEKGRAIHSQSANCGFESDMFVANTLVDMYAKCGSMVDAYRVFDRMPQHDVVSWTVMIMGYAEKELGEVALRCYARMQQEGFVPNAVTYIAALKACGCVAALVIGKKIHAEILGYGLQSNIVLATSILDMYAKCGSIIDAQLWFDALPTRTLATWNALIAGYSRQGDSGAVFSLFKTMQEEGVQPDGSTFLSVLTVCSHAGLVDDGQKYFQTMNSDYGITPSVYHYTCMVDLFGRAGRLNDAVQMVEEMPCKPNIVTWRSVLGACQKWSDVKIGRYAFECALRLDKHHGAAYMLMSNIYTNIGMMEESAKIQAMRRNVGACKMAAKSWWTDEGGTVHTFVVGDKNHPQINAIHAKLKELSVNMEMEGFVPDLDELSSPEVCGDRKEAALCGLIEKLAIACALINTPLGTPIQIVKNLRVCNDCHKATAVISKLEQRVISCRDASRFHVYKDGKCSCGDFW